MNEKLIADVEKTYSAYIAIEPGQRNLQLDLLNGLIQAVPKLIAALRVKQEEKPNSVWIVTYSEDYGGGEAIKGVFDNETDALLFVGRFALGGEYSTEYLQVTEKQIEK